MPRETVYLACTSVLSHEFQRVCEKSWQTSISQLTVFNEATSQLVTRSTRHPVNSSHSQLVTGQLVTRSTRHTVDSSQRGGQLVTSKHQSRTANNILVPQLLGHSFQKAKKITASSHQNAGLYIWVFKNFPRVIPRRPGPSQRERLTTPSHTQHSPNLGPLN